MAAPSPQLSNSNRPFDILLSLYVDAAAIVASTSGSLIVDMGDAVVHGDVVWDINALTVAVADQVYTCHLQGSNSATFANTVVILSTLTLGHATATGESNSSAVTTTKRFIQGFCNQKYGIVFRYARARIVVAGTGSPSIDPEAYLSLRR